MLKLLLLAFMSGCSFFVNKIDTALVDQKDYLKNIPEIPTFCPLTEKPTLQLVGSSSQAETIFQEFLSDTSLPPLDFFDQFALWTLLQLSIRPDQTSPTSRFQVLINWQGKSQYLDFFSEEPEDQFPLLFGVDWILKKYGKKQRLEYYTSLIDTRFPQKIRVGKVLETFLQKYNAQIKDHPQLGPLFVRGSEVLQENEKVPKLNFRDVVRHYRTYESRQKIIVNTNLTSFVTDAGHKGSCNYDFNLYDNSIFLIDKVIPVANIFGLAKTNGAFLASTSQKISDVVAINTFPLFKGESKVRSSAVCVMEEGENTIWMYSNLSRDPGQHLFHLIRYGLGASKNTHEVDKLIRHSRHLFLSDPVRLIIESNRSRSDQIENLLKLNLPIYNAERLGNIWSFTRFNNQGRFIIDDRNIGAFLCK